MALNRHTVTKQMVNNLAMMRSIYISISAMLIAAAVSGCSKSNTSVTFTPETSLDGYEPTTTPISFQTEYNWGDTKAIPTTYINFEEFGVLAYYIQDGEKIDELTPNFMYDQQVSLSKTEWSYSPIKYWPANGTVQFFGYHPYNSTGIVLSANDEKGYPSFTVTPYTKPYDQDDFIIALTEPLDNTTTSVPMSFNHKLAQAKVYVAHCGSTSASVTISSIAISGYRGTGTLIYDDTDDKFVWEHQQGSGTAPETTVTYNFNEKELKTDFEIAYLASATTDKSNYSDIDDGLGESLMMLIPQDDIGELQFLVSFIYTVNGTAVQAFQELTLADGSSLTEGESKAYLLLVDPSNVSLGSVTITSEAWSEKTINGSWQIE